TVRGVFSQFAHERANYPGSKMVNAIVVVAELGEFTFDLISGYEPGCIADHANSRVADCRQAVGNHGQSSHTESNRTQWSIVVQRHLNPLIGVLVMHVVDDVHGIYVDTGKPVHHRLEFVDHSIKVKELSLCRTNCGPYLLAADLVPASVNGIEKTLG